MSECRVEKRREAATGATSLDSRSHMVMVSLPTPVIEAQLDAGYDVATRRTVKILLSSGDTVQGNIVVYRPQGRDRLSDDAKIDERFR